MLSDIIGFGQTLLNKMFPDQNIVKEGQRQLANLTKSGELYRIAGHYGLLRAEASSLDRWTSRGRPFVVYAVLFLILLGIPFSVLYVIVPHIAIEFTHGLTLWFSCIPNLFFDWVGIILGATVGVPAVCKSVKGLFSKI